MKFSCTYPEKSVLHAFNVEVFKLDSTLRWSDWYDNQSVVVSNLISIDIFHWPETLKN